MPETISPRSNLERDLVHIWEQVLRRAPIGIRENFFDLGGTSVQAVRIFTRIEEVIHQRLPLSIILGAPTVEQLAAVLLPGKCRDRTAYLVPIQPKGENPILFCVGGGAIWRPLAEHLEPDRPIFNVGLEPRAVEQMKGPNSLEDLARPMVSALREKQPQGPYHLGGFCRDGVFAYEVARQLMMSGNEVGLLVLMEPFTPCPTAGDRFSTGLKRSIFRIGFRFSELRRMRIRELPGFARSRWKGFKLMLTNMLWCNYARLQVQKRRLGLPDFEQILFVAASSYKPKPLGCRTVIFRCKDWPMFSAGDPYFGWREFLTGKSETYEVPGDHDGVFREPSVRLFAEKLRACLQNKTLSEQADNNVVVKANRSLYLGLSRF